MSTWMLGHYATVLHWGSPKQPRGSKCPSKQKPGPRGQKMHQGSWLVTLHWWSQKGRLQPVMSLQTYTDIGCQLVIWHRGITFLCFSFQVLNQCYSGWCSEQRCSSDHCILPSSNVAWKAYTSWCMLLNYSYLFGCWLFIIQWLNTPSSLFYKTESNMTWPFKLQFDHSLVSHSIQHWINQFPGLILFFEFD